MSYVDTRPSTTHDDRTGTRRHQRRVIPTLEPSRAAGMAAAVAAGFGLVSAVLTPRGPITTFEAIITMAAALVVGGVAGFVQRSRWALLTAPVAYAVAVELARLGVVGPTVDFPDASSYGLIAVATGRGIHGLLTFLPMMLGAALGAGTARTMGASGQAATPTGRMATVVASIAVLALAVGVARPASTDPILDRDGEPLRGSVAELTDVEVDGHELTMMIRGHDASDPVVLFLAGGPGGTELGAMRRHLEALEQHYVVVTLDQRGTGKSYDQLDPTSTLTVESAVEDVVAVTRYLQERFGQDRIYLLGQSWGSILGPLTVQRHPDLYAAYIGTGQMVSPSATDRAFYDETLEWAVDRGDLDLANRLAEIGPPPYDDIRLYGDSLGIETSVNTFDRSTNSEGAGGFSENLFVEEYTLLEQVHALGAMLDTFSVLYPQIQDVDFRVDVPELDVPVYFVQGAHEAPGRMEPFTEWFEMLEAPRKELVTIEHAGHRPLFQEPDAFTAFMADLEDHHS